MESPFCSIESAIEEIRAGRMVVVVDDEDRENEGDLTLAAEKVTPEAINFMAKHGRGVICEIMNDDGTMARVPDLIGFCETHGLKLMTVADLIRYRMKHERYVHRVGEALLPTPYGEFRMIAYESEIDGESHVALIRGQEDDFERRPVLVRMHAHCLAGDVFGAAWCDCRETIAASLRQIAEHGEGALIYLHQTSKGFSIERVGDRPTLAFHRESRDSAHPEHQ